MRYSQTTAASDKAPRPLSATATWLYFAQAVGKILGASDSSDYGGVMSNGPLFQREFTFPSDSGNPSEICTTISSGACFSSYTATCGNLIIEPGEQCDDATACCDASTCLLASAASCSYSTDSKCCGLNCKIKPTNTSCTAVGGMETGYCVNGLCRQSRLALAYGNLGGCAPPSSNPCREHASYSGTCGYYDATVGAAGGCKSTGPMAR
jgi:hypothetical protein